MRRAAITTTRLINWLKAGRGQGVGKGYRPWLQVSKQDHASLGQSHILYNPFLERQHHLLSNLERSICVLNMAQPCIVDIREQYPIWSFQHPSPLGEICASAGNLAEDRFPDSQGSLELAKQLNIRHARFVGLQVPYIYTTDQLLTIRLPDRPAFLVAVSIKYWSDLRGEMNSKKSKSERVRARKSKFRKLKLERAYWRSLGAHWMLATDRQINHQVHLNLEWALSGAIQRLSDNDVLMLKHFVSAWCAVEWHGRCLDQIKAICIALKINTSTAIRFLKFAIMRSLIPVDLTRPVHLQLPFPHGEEQSPFDIPSWSLLSRIRGFK